eukprot:COSAG06_NODE_4045_length_4634_cov_7.279603_2_plen_77_part_00
MLRRVMVAEEIWLCSRTPWNHQAVPHTGRQLEMTENNRVGINRRVDVVLDLLSLRYMYAGSLSIYGTRGIVGPESS